MLSSCSAATTTISGGCGSGIAWSGSQLGKAIPILLPAGCDALGRLLPIHQLGHKAHKLADRLQHVSSADDLYFSLVSEWRDPAALLLPDTDGSAIQKPSSLLDWHLPDALSHDSVARMMAYDTLNYLPNDILTKLDPAAMATSLETRAPFIDHRLAELAWRLSMTMKIRQGPGGGTSKWALRQILNKHVPRQLNERPKAGFGMPIGQWLRGPLRPLDQRPARSDGDATTGLPAARTHPAPLAPAPQRPL